MTTREKIISLRNGTKKSKEIQSRQDYTDEIKHLEGLCEIEAIGDIVVNKKVSVLDNAPKRKCQASQSTINRIRNSSFQRAFDAMPKRIVAKKKNEIISFAVTEVNKDSKLVDALALLRESREVPDPPRLYFEAGMLFDELNMSERALAALMKSTRNIPPDAVVTMYDLPITPAYLRKIRVMSKFQEEDLKRKREELRISFVAVEYERQRLRGILAYCHGMRLHLDFENYDEAYRCMNEAFLLAKEGDETIELLWYFHFLMLDFWDQTKSQLTGSEKLLRDTGGPIAEAHIHVLLQLLELEPKNTDLMNLLGHRYGQCFNFALSTRYYTMARLNTLHASGQLDMLDLDGPDPEGAAVVVASRRRIAAKAKVDKELTQNLSKVVRINYHVDNEIDEAKRVNREDFCSFHGRHLGSSVLLYTAPNLGWEKDAESRENKFLGKLTTRELEEKQQAQAALPRIRFTSNRLK